MIYTNIPNIYTIFKRYIKAAGCFLHRKVIEMKAMKTIGTVGTFGARAFKPKDPCFGRRTKMAELKAADALRARATSFVKVAPLLGE